jgi:IS30 family transposase
LDIPIAIFHGKLDGTVSIKGVREAEKAFRAAGKTHRMVRAYPDHDLNWTIEAATRATVQMIRRIPLVKRNTMTLNNGKEFLGFRKIGSVVGDADLFVYPYSVWEGEIYENTNGLLW